MPRSPPLYAPQSHHPLLWGPERLAWLEGSPLRELVAARQAQVGWGGAARVMTCLGLVVGFVLGC